MDINLNTNFLELLINTIPNPVFYKNRDGVYEHCNDAFAELILGIPKNAIVGKSLFDIPQYIPYDLAKIYKEKDDALFNNPKEIQEYEADVKCSDNTRRRFKFHKAVLCDEDGNVLGLVGVMLDVTEVYNSRKELNEKNQLLEKMTYKDPLTEIYNRRMFNEIFNKLLKNAKRAQKVFNLIMLDVDSFKLYNDTYGHIKGDQALVKIATILEKNLMRDDDYCFRLGGEEFAVIFSTNEIESANNIAQTIRTNIEGLNMTHITENKNVTVSIGLISVKDEFEKGQDFYYTEVDKLLYKAKENGKNQVIQSIM